MGELVRLGEIRRRRQGPVCFTRPELNLLLSLYSRRVMLGEWRDYALRLAPGMAAFSIFKSALDKPLYTVAKFRPGAIGPAGDFLVSQGAKRMKQAKSLAEALEAVDRRPHLVYG
jgi:hypothetical protein